MAQTNHPTSTYRDEADACCVTLVKGETVWRFRCTDGSQEHLMTAVLDAAEFNGDNLTWSDAAIICREIELLRTRPTRESVIRLGDSSSPEHA